MVEVPTLQTERLIVRPFAIADAPRIEALLASPEIAPTTLTMPRRFPAGMAERWIRSQQAVIIWAFDGLELARIEGMCFPRNPASGRVMEKAGMAFEGRLRSYVVKDGISEDVLVYAIVNHDA
jgi:RimJ/RimL family protein N-acetyltransferase